MDEALFGQWNAFKHLSVAGPWYRVVDFVVVALRDRPKSAGGSFLIPVVFLDSGCLAHISVHEVPSPHMLPTIGLNSHLRVTHTHTPTPAPTPTPTRTPPRAHALTHTHTRTHAHTHTRTRTRWFV